MSGFQPYLICPAPETQGDALGWYNGAPLALGFAYLNGVFPARLAVRLAVRRKDAIAWGSFLRQLPRLVRIRLRARTSRIR